MKRLWIMPGYITLTLMIFCSTVFAEQRFTVMTEKNPPFNFEHDGVVQGIGADLLILMMERIGQPVKRSTIQLMPWNRAYKIVREQSGTMLFSMARTAAREKLFAWVGPIYNLQIGLIAPRHKKIVINRLEDAKKYKIGTIREGAPEQIVIQGGIDPKNLLRSDDPVLSIKKLAAGQIDMFAFNVPAANFIMLQQGMNTTDFEVICPLKNTALYYAFHKETDSDLIQRMNQTLLQLKKKDRTYGKILSKYLGSAFKYLQNRREE